MKNKKAAEMTISTMVIIVLALVFLVVMIIGFTGGWSNLFSKLNIFGGGEVNVQTVVQSCQIACSTQSVYDYCTKTTKVTFTLDKTSADFIKNKKYTCNELEGLGGTGLICENIECVATGIENGICSGTPSPSCSSQDNRGKTNCQNMIGCNWKDDIAQTDANLGVCEIDSTVTCDTYNNNPTNCEALGCSWKSI